MKTIPDWFWNKLPIAKVDLLTLWIYSQNSSLLEFLFYPIDLRLLQRYLLIKICENLWKQRANWACSMSAANLNLSFVSDLSVCDESRLTTEDLRGCAFKNVSGKVNRPEIYQVILNNNTKTLFIRNEVAHYWKTVFSSKPVSSSMINDLDWNI